MSEKSTHGVISSYLLDAFFPRHCLWCSQLLPASEVTTYLCDACRELLTLSTVSRCAFCPNAVTQWQTCPTCKKHHVLDRLFVATDYRDTAVERMVKALKYRFVPAVAHDMGILMARYLRERMKELAIPNSEIILTSIPLHPKRLRWRGFNQANLIAQALADELHLAVDHELLVRTKHIKPQAEIADRKAREENARDLFALNQNAAQRPLFGKTVIIIDDVATTSSTLENAAKILDRNGPREIIGFVFARG